MWWIVLIVIAVLVIPALVVAGIGIDRRRNAERAADQQLRREPSASGDAARHGFGPPE